MLSANVLHYGQEAPLPPALPLRAGPVSLIFEAGDLRYLRCAGREAIRRIYAAVRDANWGTVPGEISNLEMKIEFDRFRISYLSVHRRNEIHFRWQAEITGTAQGVITMQFSGEALASFRRNRIGICIHHPIAECAGRDCQVEHPDGSVTHGRFPDFIAPHQPFFELRAIRHEIAPQLSAEVRFEGECFEMEDQRNWSDASFKTYGTPLALPYPVEVPAGTKIRQSVQFRLLGKAPRGAPASSGRAMAVTVGAEERRLPRLGLQLAPQSPPLSALETARVRALGLAHLYAHAKELERAHRESAALGLPLELAVFLGEQPEAQLRDLRRQLASLQPAIARCLLYDANGPATSNPSLRLARQLLPGVPLCGGADTNFTELNRNRPDPALLDGVCFAINPQVHAFDNASLIENCAAQSDIVRSARHCFPAKALAAGPVTLKPRSNPVATVAEAPPAPGELPSAVDPRQMSLFCAGWTLGSFAALASAGVDSITYYETTGWLGVMETAAGSPAPARFRSLPAMVFPVWHLLAALGEFREGTVRAAATPAPLEITAIVLQLGSRRRVLLANHTSGLRTLQLPAGILAKAAWLRLLDASHAVDACTQPEQFRVQTAEKLTATRAGIEVRLPPFALAQIDDFPSGQEAAP